LSFAQVGEDRIIRFLFQSKGIKHPSYLELGVFHPDKFNNTYLFYCSGSRGVLVEADYTLIPSIKNVRPRDLLLNVGVGEGDPSEMIFYIFKDRGLNTFDETEAKNRMEAGAEFIKTVKVPIKSINSILSENFESPPDLLSIDIEGLDLFVLKSLNYSKFPIPVICAETCAYSNNHIKETNPEIEQFLSSQGYFVYADTYVNTIFVKKDWFYTDNRN
jgi:FkbM family methyltransferase